MLHGWEKVTPKGKAGVSDGDTTIVNPISIDGEAFLRVITKKKKLLGIA